MNSLFDTKPEVDPRDRQRKTPLPPIPATGWRAPAAFPNLAAARTIALDVETWDPEFTPGDAGDKGPGWARGKGHLIGISVAVDTVNKWYFPMRHEVRPEENLDPQHVLAWARDTFANSKQSKVGANLMYDVGWLKQEGVNVAGPLLDVQFAEALLSENGKTSLEHLSQKYLGGGKETSVLYDWIDSAYGKASREGKQRKHLYKAPPSLVGPYAEVDAANPLLILPRQTEYLVQEGLYHIFDMECSLIPLIIAMRFAGVSVDLNKAEEVRSRLLLRSQEVSREINSLCGFEVNVNASKSLAKAFDAFGLKYPTTDKGSPSFEAAFLEKVEHPLGKLVVKLRQSDKLRSTFIESYILDSHVNGKVHGQYHPLRGSEGGTRSGRWSSSTPNLQNIPSRDEELSPLLRGIFVPDAGHKCWRKYDYGQIEYRFLIHYAVGAGSDEARDHFAANPDTDYHELALALVAPVAGWDLSTKEMHKKYRKAIKTTNFGLIYGMGKKKLTRSLGLTKPEGDKLFQAYHQGVPFAKATMESTSAEAQRQGFITTYLGRRSRFDTWEPDTYAEEGDEDDRIPLPYKAALSKWGQNIRRAGLHKALNRRLQGSAADLLKVAVVRLWQEGVFDYIGVPRLQVHDELDFSDPGGRDDGFDYMQHVLETALPLRVPVQADGDWGPDWGHVEAIKKPVATD